MRANRVILLAVASGIAVAYVPAAFGSYYNLGAFWKASAASCSTIAYVQSTQGAASSDTATATLTVGAGHLLVAAVYYSNGNGSAEEAASALVFDSADNTWQAAAVQNDITYGAAQIWFATNVASGSDTVTVTVTEGGYQPLTNIFLMEYSGVATSNAVDVSTGQANGNSSNLSSTGNMTTTETCNDLVVAAFTNSDDSPDAFTASSGWTNRQSNNAAYFSTMFEDDLPTGAAKNSVVNASATTVNNNLSWAATGVAFRAQGSSTPQQPTKVAFTTSAQSLNTWTCSGPITIQGESSAGAALPTQSTISINLTGTDVQFYSDSACTLPITSTSIGIGTTSQTVYLEYSGVASGIITAAPTNGFSSISQTETVSTVPFTWIGGGSCNGVWSTGACWQGGVAPSSAQVAQFDSTCTSNCSASLGATTSVGGIFIHTGYASTVNANGYNLTLGTAIASEPDYPSGNGWTNIGYGLVLEAGTFDSGSGTLTVQGNAVLGSGGTWNGNSATITLDGEVPDSGGAWNPGTSSVLLSGGSLLPSFYNLTVGDTAYLSSTAASIAVNGNLVVSNTCTYCGSNCYNMTVAGNWTSNGPWNVTGCNESVTFSAGANHTIGGTANVNFGQLIIDNSSSATNNTITFAAGNTITVNAGTTFKGDGATYPLKLRSSTPGTQWKINSSGTNTVSQVDVEDSDNTNGTAIVDSPGVDSGNNTNWTIYETPALVQNPVVYDSTSCTACTITMSSTGTGNLLVVAAAWAGSATVSSVTDNASSGGNSYSSAETAATSTAPAGGTAIYYAQNSKSGATTITLNLSASSKPSIFVYEYSGMATSSALDTSAISAKNNATASKNVTGTSVTTTSALEIIFGVAYGPGTISSLSTGSLFTAATIENGYDAATYATSATGAYTAGWKQGTTDTYSVATASFKVGTH